VKLIELNYQTNGAAETLLFGLNKMYRKDIATTMTESEEKLLGKEKK
jgi:hypothetical protein